MTKDKYVISKTKRYPYYILMLAILIWFATMEIFGANERNLSSPSHSPLYTGSFFIEKENGKKESISVPGQYPVSVGDPLVVTTILPADYHEHSIAFRSSLQDVKCYINGKLRTEYSTKNTRLCGKNSASRYIFCDTSADDAGKELRIELTTHTSQYSGVINPVYCGDRIEIWTYIFEENGLEAVIAFFILFSGIVTVIFSIALGLVYKAKFDMEYLGWCMIMGATWLLGESNLRQLLFPNSSILGALCFVMIMLVPVPMLFYADSVLHGKYRRLYEILGCTAVLNFTICTILHILGIADYIETLSFSLFLLITTFIVILVSFFRCTQNGTIHSNWPILIGLTIVMFSVTAESIAIHFVISLSGIFIGIGMLCLLFVNILHTVKTVRTMKEQRQESELYKLRQHSENLTLQMMQTLATAIEAKDEYTCGHSQRVSLYATLIAHKLGLNADEILNLKYAAYLHDIGKIGIPDTILNKPSRLTPEEYAVTKEHTVIGSEILNNITLVKHVSEVARSHHERYDGTGYPDGLTGTDIPLYARIISVADSYDVMHTTTARRKALSDAEICKELEENKCSQFDPVIADVMINLINTQQLKHIEPSDADHERNFSSIESDINEFITNVMTTLKEHENSESYDFLTGLPMRNRGEQLVSQAMKKNDGCLIFIDMDNLKKINDIYGHNAGDRALKLLGSLLADFASDAVVCRLGGDEFLLFVPAISEESVFVQVTSLFTKFNTVKSEDTEIRSATLSAGMCMTTVSDSFEDCYTKADKALYYVKQTGKNSLYFYHHLEKNTSTESPAKRKLAQVLLALHDSGTYYGALGLDYRHFSKIYEYLSKQNVQYRHQSYLIMITVKNACPHEVCSKQISAALEGMEQSISKCIRPVDIYSRYSPLQYLIILSEIEEDQLHQIMTQLFKHYAVNYGKQQFIPTFEYTRI